MEYIYSIPDIGKKQVAGYTQPRMSAAEYLLRIKGDWRGYATLLESGAITANKFQRLMIGYYAGNMKHIEGLRPLEVGNGLLLATSVWGEAYMARFLGFCIPSLIANLDALSTRRTVLLIYTDKAGWNAILQDKGIELLANAAIEIRLVLLDEELLAEIQMAPQNKYWHLGMTQSLHLAYARQIGAAYHILMPDVVYSAGYFKCLLTLSEQHPIILQATVSTDGGKVDGMLEAYRDGVALRVPQAELMDIGMRHIHPRFQPYEAFMGKYPKGHFAFWRGKSALHMISPHQSISYIAHEALLQVPERFFMTLDSELEKIIPEDVAVYCPKHGDQLAMIEISDETDVVIPDGYHTNVEAFAKMFWNRIRERELLRFFAEDIIFPITYGEGMEEEAIVQMKKQIREAVSA